MTKQDDKNKAPGSEQNAQHTEKPIDKTAHETPDHTEHTSDSTSKMPAAPTNNGESEDSVTGIPTPQFAPVVMPATMLETLVPEGSSAPQFPEELPVLPVRDVVVFNNMILPLFIGREKSAAAVELASSTHRFIMICTQKNEETEDPNPDDLYTTGTIAAILRMMHLPDGRIKVLAQGLCRARIKKVVQESPCMIAQIDVLAEQKSIDSEVEGEALLRTAREASERILTMRGVATADMFAALQGMNDMGRLADLIAAHLRMDVEISQSVLEALDPVERLRLVNTHLLREEEVAAVQARIQGAAREGMDKAHKEYYLREQLKAIRTELGEEADENAELDDLKQALDHVGLPRTVHREVDKQMHRLTAMHPDSSEAAIARTYLEWIAELPWKKMSRDQFDISKARKILDEDHYSLEKVKDRILEYLSVRKLNPNSKGAILCFSGPPGVGKTSLGRSIARAIGRKFQRISLGGMRDEAEIRGHRRTYIGAMPGRIIQAMKQAGTRNPVIVLDEVDKLGTDFRGDPSSALLEVLDPEQNANFSDHYLNVPFDLSKVMFICTANHLENIPSPLRDRMEVITLPGYTEQEKMMIARKHLVPRQIQENGLEPSDVTLADTALAKIIRSYTREGGLRNLERELGGVCRKLARRKAEGEHPPFKVNAANLSKLLGAPRFIDEEKELELKPGVALGLAWTHAGGEVLHVEVCTMKGKGTLILTGQLGDVMKESAQAACSYARSRAQELNIDPDFLGKLDIHIHVPSGATPKDGPSAGVTLVSALISALTNKPINSGLCMTGEITLRGRILPVGGIKEKVLAAVARGMVDVVIPKQNIKDLEDIPKDLLRQIRVHPVADIDELLPLAFSSALSKEV